jgi:DNA-3-methyladenine glycosylase I
VPITRCEWPKSDLLIAYHDEEWGEPSCDDRHLFEHIVLEGAQAGLNWELVLRKREGYRRAFADYDLAKIARFTEARIEKLAQDPGIVRNRAKIRSVIVNARAALKVQDSSAASRRSSGTSPAARRDTTAGRSWRRSPR